MKPVHDAVPGCLIALHGSNNGYSMPGSFRQPVGGLHLDFGNFGAKISYDSRKLVRFALVIAAAYSNTCYNKYGDDGFWDLTLLCDSGMTTQSLKPYEYSVIGYAP